MEIFFEEKWLEVLGCGIVHPKILHNCGLPISKGASIQAWVICKERILEANIERRLSSA